jgi:hypothetical protein
MYGSMSLAGCPPEFSPERDSLITSLKEFLRMLRAAQFSVRNKA